MFDSTLGEQRLSRVTTLVAFGVFVAAITSLVVLWALFFTMWLDGETRLVLYANRFGEFWIELIGLTLSIVFLPVLLYETSEIVCK